MSGKRLASGRLFGAAAASTDFVEGRRNQSANHVRVAEPSLKCAFSAIAESGVKQTGDRQPVLMAQGGRLLQAPYETQAITEDVGTTPVSLHGVQVVVEKIRS